MEYRNGRIASIARIKKLVFKEKERSIYHLLSLVTNQRLLEMAKNGTFNSTDVLTRNPVDPVARLLGGTKLEALYKAQRKRKEKKVTNRTVTNGHGHRLRAYLQCSVGVLMNSTVQKTI